MLVLDFMVNFRLKIVNDISVESMEYLNKKKEKKKYNNFCISGKGQPNQITTCTKLLNIKYAFYVFSGDLITETIN